MINRVLEENIKNKMGKGKALVLIGARQTGKTTLIQNILAKAPHLFFNGDDPKDRATLEEINTEELRSLLGNHKTVFIDEAQRIANIGLTLKLITDQFKDVQLLVSGSSAFELSNRTNESLAGRKWEYCLYPICWKEFEHYLGYKEAVKQLHLRLIYGFYPDVINSIGNEAEVLKQLVSSVLYKDILAAGGIRKPDVLEKLLKAIALQLGSEVSYNELAQLVGVDKNTISTYIGLLEQSFIIFRLGSFSRNLRNEIKNNRKIYFYDTGIRNAILGNFSPLDLRQDKGALWENFLLSERLKLNHYRGSMANTYFWRTTEQQEIDYIEEENGKLKIFEFKWLKKTKTKIPITFTKAYQAEVKIIDSENFIEFLSVPK